MSPFSTKHIISTFFMIIVLVFSVPLANVLANDPTAATTEAAQTVRGFVIADDVFFEMEKGFRQNDFSGDMASLALSDTQTLVFNPKQENRLLPNLSVSLASAEVFSEDLDALSTTLGSLIETMQLLQEQFPDSFLFNDELAASHEAGISYAISDPEIWLWPESAQAVLIPVFFYENEHGMLIDDIYLLEVLAAADGTLYYILYNDPQHVVDYIAHVTISGSNSLFQHVLALWYVENQTMVNK